MRKVKKLSELKEADYNPRRISPDALKGLKYSLEEFGDLSGIVFNGRTGNLVAGHQRVKALKEQYGDLTIHDDSLISPNGNFFRIRIVDWDIPKEKAANIAANSITIQGEFTRDLNQLLEEVALELPETAENLSFGSMFIEDMTLQEESIELPKEDTEGPEQKRSVKFGTITIYLTDREAEELERRHDVFKELNGNNYGFFAELLGI